MTRLALADSTEQGMSLSRFLMEYVYLLLMLRSTGLTNFFKTFCAPTYTIIKYGKLYGISQHSMTFTEFRRKYWPSVSCYMHVGTGHAPS
jgi:hypothetical protein